MKIRTGTALLTLLLLLTAGGICGDGLDDKLKVSGAVRFRTEIDAKDFDSDTDPHSFHLLRTRLNLEFYPSSETGVLLQLQDSRTLGSPASGTLGNDANLGVHQAFIQLDSWLFEGLYHRFGRFEYAKGNQRLLGTVGWHNVGRTWDGVMMGWRQKDLTIEGFLLKNEEGALLLNDDKDLLGLYLSVSQVDLFFLYERDNYRDPESRRQDRFTLGGYSARSLADFDYIANVAYQFGQTDFDATDISAYLLALELGYSVPARRPLRIAAGFDITSGDDDALDKKVKTFDNLYYTGHKFRGHMDYFVSAASYGLNDYMLRCELSPAINWRLNGDLHIFRSNQEYYSNHIRDSAESLGTEVDLYAKHDRGRATFLIGLSAFFPSDDWRGDDADPSYWAFLQLTAGF